MSRNFIGLVFFLHLGIGCTGNKLDFVDIIEVKSQKQEEKSLSISQTVPFQSKSGTTDSEDNKSSRSIEWQLCSPGSPLNGQTFLALSGEGFDFSGSNFCGTWLPQVFLKERLGFLAVNLPSQGRSTGSSDYFGPLMQQAVTLVIKDVLQVTGGKAQVSGAFGYQETSIVAAFFSKHNPAIKTLILGSGVYDFEIYHKKMASSPQKEALNKLVAEEKDQFYEQRSIAWELDGLPGQIFIYHGKQDEVVEESQVSTFRNGMAAKEYKIKYYVLDDQKHDIAKERQSAVLSEILKGVK